jgi:hypothetical protein
LSYRKTLTESSLSKNLSKPSSLSSLELVQLLEKSNKHHRSPNIKVID